MRITIKQVDRQHDANQLHDDLIAAGLSPALVESDANETRIDFKTDEEGRAARQFLNSYQPTQREPPPDVEALGRRLRTATTYGEQYTVLLELLAAERGVKLKKDKVEPEAGARK